MLIEAIAAGCDCEKSHFERASHRYGRSYRYRYAHSFAGLSAIRLSPTL